MEIISYVLSGELAHQDSMGNIEGIPPGDERAELALDPARKAYVHLARGTLDVNGMSISAGDALLVDAETQLNLANGRQAEVLVFDLAA